MKKITIVGTGYVGLVHGATLADHGNHVVCLDIDREKVDSLKSGNLPIYEPGLEELVKRGVSGGRLTFTDSYEKAIPGADVCFMCLPTPSNVDESCNLSYLLYAAKQVAEKMDNYLVIVNKSTVPMGTAEQVRNVIQETLYERGVEIPFDVVSNPEFLCEGSAVADSMNPSRILLGVDSSKAASVMHELYAPFSIRPKQLMTTDIVSAELAKYAANTMLASRISLMNTFSLLCEKLGGNIDDIRLAIGADERIGHLYLNAGLGFGGSCLPKDVQALRSLAQKEGIDSSILDSILAVNARQRALFFEKIENFFDCLAGKTIALWGLSFKADTDDMRDAPSLYLIDRLIEMGASLRVYDPAAMPKVKVMYNQFPQIHFSSDEYEAAFSSHAIVLVTEWKQFQQVDFDLIGPTMKEKVLFDGRNQFNEKEMERLGFDYFSLGKGAKAPHAIHG